jgi:hypothetical protein
MSVLIYNSIYFLITAWITIYVGYQLYRKGIVFVQSILPEWDEYIIPINRMLLAGYYLVNIGFVLLYMSETETFDYWSDFIFSLAFRIGVVTTALGLLHYLNITVLLIIRRFVTTKT